MRKHELTIIPIDGIDLLPTLKDNKNPIEFHAETNEWIADYDYFSQGGPILGEKIVFVVKDKTENGQHVWKGEWVFQ